VASFTIWPLAGRAPPSTNWTQGWVHPRATLDRTRTRTLTSWSHSAKPVAILHIYNSCFLLQVHGCTLWAPLHIHLTHLAASCFSTCTWQNLVALYSFTPQYPSHRSNQFSSTVLRMTEALRSIETEDYGMKGRMIG
jgi:hypothetical protein